MTIERRYENIVFVDKMTCVGCGRCQTFCPENALWAWGYLEIDHQKCTECLICIENCPVDALSFT